MMVPVQKALEAISKRRGDAVVVSTMMTSREWPRVTTREELDLPLTGCMGKASSLGLGIALAQPERRVIVLDGDGSLLMNLGSMVTIAGAKPKNLIHCVFENGIYEITGGQPIPGEGTFSFGGIARGAGYANVVEVEDEATLESKLDQAFSKPGPTFVMLRVSAVGGKGDRPKRNTSNSIKEVTAVLAGAR